MIFKGNGIIWDAEKDRALCNFQDGEFHTKDKRVMQLLQDYGLEYEYENGDEEVEESEDDSLGTDHKTPSIAELKAMLNEKGIRYNNDDNKKTLLNLLEGAE